MAQLASDVIVGYLTALAQSGLLFSNNDIRTELPAFGRLRFGVNITAITYVRKLQQLRKNGSIDGIFIFEETIPTSQHKEKRWSVKLVTSE